MHIVTHDHTGRRLVLFATFTRWVIILASMQAAAPVRGDVSKTLSLPAVKVYEPSAEADIAAFLVNEEAVFSVPAYGRDILRSAYTPTGKDAVAAFQMKSRLDIPAQRLPLWPEERRVKLRALFSPDPAILVAVDGFEAKLFAYHLTKKVVVDKGDIALDLVKAPRDSRGEATARETAGLRARFSKALHQSSDRAVIAGITTAPPWLARDDKATQLVLTNIPGFPLTTMRCSQETWTQCMLTRACFVTLPKTLSGSEWAGLAYSRARDLLVVGNRSAQRLELFRGKSCFGIRHVGSIALDPKIKPLRSVYVDAHDHLWLSTSQPDDYLNASILRWDAGQW